MATYSRSNVVAGQQITLRVIFTDAEGNLVAPDAMPDLYFYDSTIDTTVIDSEVEAATFTSAISGPLVPTQLAVGFYEYTYTVSTSAEAGPWYDVWYTSFNGSPSYQILSFIVSQSTSFQVQTLGNNELIIIQLDGAIASLDGTLLLTDDVQISFTTKYSPLYASPDLLRLEVGPWVDYIPDNTLALMIHWASKEADFILGWNPKSAERLSFARTKFVIFDAALKALSLPNGASRQSGGSPGASKRLGDLAISAGGGLQVARTASGIDIDTLKSLREQRKEWERVVNAGGNIMPGQSFNPAVAVRGKYDPDRRPSGRLWLEPDEYHYSQPTQNTKVFLPGANRGKFYYTPYSVPYYGESLDDV